MSGGRDSPLFGAAAAKGAKDLSAFGDRIKSKLAAATPSVASAAFPSRASSTGGDFNIKFVAADDDLDIDDILAAAKRKGATESGEGVPVVDGGGTVDAGTEGTVNAGVLFTEGDGDEKKKSVHPPEKEGLGRYQSRLRRLAHFDSDSAGPSLSADNFEFASADAASDGVSSAGVEGDASTDGVKNSSSTPIPISPELLKKSEDKMKRNLMKVLDFQTSKTRSLDSVTLSNLIHETDDAKIANAASASEFHSGASSLETGGETGGEKETSPTKKPQGFFDDLQSKLQQKSKELQLSSPVNSRNIIEDLQHRWATHRGSREATPTPDASNASPEGPSPGTSPPTRAGNILDDIKELLSEKRDKFEEEMSKRKAARGGTYVATSEEPGVEEAPAEVLHQSPRVHGRTSPVQLPARSTSPLGPGPASRGHSPSHRSASSKDNSPQGTLNFSEMLARVKSRSKSTLDADNVSPSRTPPVVVSTASISNAASPSLSAAASATQKELASATREPLENIMSEDESDSPQDDKIIDNVAATNNQPDSYNENHRLKSPKAAGTDTADVAVAYSIYNPPSTLRTPPTPLGLPLPSLFTSLSLKRRLCYVIVFLLSLFILPIPRFLAGALFSAIVTTVFWSMYLIAEVGLTPAMVEEKKKTPVDKYEDVSCLPYRVESTFPQLSSTNPTVLTGWLNLLPFPYEAETYHVAQTQCVFATLDLIDATLTLRRPAKSNAVPKRAMPKEKVPSPPASTEDTPAASEEDGVHFVDTRRYRLTDAQVELYPLGLVGKRLFSKKYPIAVTLPDDDDADTKKSGVEETMKSEMCEPDFEAEAEAKSFSDGEQEGNGMEAAAAETNSPKLRRRRAEKKDSEEHEKQEKSEGDKRGKEGEIEQEVEEEEEEEARDGDSKGTEEFLADLGYEFVRKETLRMKTLHLFTRSCREKEEWFQKLTYAVQPKEVHLAMPPRVSDTQQAVPTRRTEVANDVSQSVVFRKGTLFETLERDPSLGGDNFEGCLEDDRIEFGAVADEHGSAFEDGNAEFGDYLSSAVDRDKSNTEPEDADEDKSGGSADNDVSSKSPPLQRSSSTSAFPLPRASSSSSFTRNPTADSTSPHPRAPARSTNGNPHLWLNALLTRLFWDFLREAKWRRLLVEKIQKKLGKMHLPHFMDELRVTEMDLGRSLPELLAAGSPYRDAHGLWVQMDVDYRGSAKMTLETKMNLMKLKRRASTSGEKGAEGGGGIEMTAMDGRMDVGEEKSEKLDACYDEDAEDSAESDSEIEDNDDSLDSSREENSQLHLQQPQGKSKKILNFIDKMASNKYFQQATEVGVIKKAMEGVSNTRLILSVTVESLVGTLALNVPPFPSDRLWWGFVEEPKLQLSVTPRIGDKEVTLTQVTEWIESRLKLELSKILVLPNMDDVMVPLLNSIFESSTCLASTEDDEATH